MSDDENRRLAAELAQATREAAATGAELDAISSAKAGRSVPAPSPADHIREAMELLADGADVWRQVRLNCGCNNCFSKHAHARAAILAKLAAALKELGE